jgi:hypothetical protein
MPVTVDYRYRVGQALELLADGLGPFVDRQMRAANGENWAEAFPQQRRGLSTAERLRDPSFLLKVMVEAWRSAFGARLSHAERSLVFELRDTWNRWAHHEPFDADDAYRCFGSVERLLVAADAREAGTVGHHKAEMRRLLLQSESQATGSVAGTAGPSDGTAPGHDEDRTGDEALGGPVGAPGPHEVPQLRLGNGAVIEHPLDEALRFVQSDGTYQGYDAVVVDPYQLCEADLHLANRMIARMGGAEIAAVLGRRAQVEAALALVPATATLAGPEGTVPWGPLRELYAALDGLPGIGLARATKILHKKRPALVPVLDEVVVRYLDLLPGPAAAVSGTGDGALGPVGARRELQGHDAPGLAGTAVRLTRSYHRELQAALPVLARVRDELACRGYRLTECRLLDIYLWAYSGTYEPLWQRRSRSAARPDPGAAPSGHVRPVAPADAGPAHLRPGTVRFWRDDAGYLDWLRSHTSGFVVNCDRQPKAQYLKLHRTNCRHLNRTGVRSWTEPYMKVCADSVQPLDDWALATAGARPDRCPACQP